MGSSSPATTQQSQSQNTTQNPWAAAVPMLNDLISRYTGTSTAITPAQQQAGQALTSSAQGIPNLSPQATTAVQNLFANAGMLPNTLAQTQANLGGIASANPDPWKDPGVADQLAALQRNITSGVKGTYAASGRDPSGAGGFAGSLSEGLARGMAPTVMNQYNTDIQNKMAAANALQAAGINTNTAEGQAALTAMSGAGMIPGLSMGPATAQWGAANAVQAQPFQNMSPYLAAALGLGGMGGQTSGTGWSIGTQQPANNPFSNILGGLAGGAGILGALGQAGGSAGIAGLAPLLAISDRRAKVNIKDVGRTHDNQKIYSFRYKGHPAPQIGMMADEVEKKHPEAVATGPGGLKYVNYDAATRKAATMGMLSKMAA